MQIGMIGLGRMGGNMAERLVRGGHVVVGYARHAEMVRASAARGVVPATSIENVVQQLTTPRLVWLMVPSGDATEETIAALLPHLASGDVIIDGGNSRYTDSVRRAAKLAERGIHLVDVGTSGGVWGLKEGYCLMVGGDAAAVERLTPIFQTLAPAADHGWAHLGASGAGHFVKMIH
ncbi:MAG: NAD(P)-binding domain-containing protein, partial [Gemmatimonadaceae bacterium]